MNQETGSTRKGKTAVIDDLIAASRAGFAIVVESRKDIESSNDERKI